MMPVDRIHDSRNLTSNLRYRGVFAKSLDLGQVALTISMLTISSIMAGCNLDSNSENPQDANGWTSCTGPAFLQLSQDNQIGPGPALPVFKINEKLVLAVPKRNWPSAELSVNAPRKCSNIFNLPKVSFLNFVIMGNWSGTYNPDDVPQDGSKKRFAPDLVTVRIEVDPPSPLSIEEQNKVKHSVDRVWNEDLLNKRDVGGLTCGWIGNYNTRMGGMLCSGKRDLPDSDTIRLSTFEYLITPFYLIQADYQSSNYGRIHIYWQVWTADVAHGRDIDRAIWNAITSWNLIP